MGNGDQRIDLDDIQGNILRGYAMGSVRHLVVTVSDVAAARRFLGELASGGSGPQLTSAAPWGEKPRTCLNVGATFTGLRALGVPKASLDSFPGEFREGAVGRAAKVGDIGASEPAKWRQNMGDPDKVHLMWSAYGTTPADRDELSDQLERNLTERGAFIVTARFDGESLPNDEVHFGYRDGISQPRFKVNGEFIGRTDGQPVAPVGSVLLGYESSFPGLRWNVPEPSSLGFNGTFNAFRVLEQDVDAFEDLLRTTAAEHHVDPEWVAAKLMGRWRNGVPLTMSPAQPMEITPEIEDNLNDFDYLQVNDHPYPDDYAGTVCPVGSHIRRTNPRGSRIMQRTANHTRRLVRRSIPYGKRYDPARPRDGVARGLLGCFMCSSLLSQFEAIMYDWINLGLQDPRITGTNDVIIGANTLRASRFEIPVDEDPLHNLVVSRFSRLTETIAAAYYFVPSLSAVRHLAGLGEADSSSPTSHAPTR